MDQCANSRARKVMQHVVDALYEFGTLMQNEQNMSADRKEIFIVFVPAEEMHAHLEELEDGK